MRNALTLTGADYQMDLAWPRRRRIRPPVCIILCNPHNPVGRVWTLEELRAVAVICAEHDVFILSDEIHADIVLPPHKFVPFAAAAAGIDVARAATRGPIKTFGLAGVCDTLLVTDRDVVADRFQSRSSQLHLTRNNVFGLTTFETAHRRGGPWLDDLLELVARNRRVPDQWCGCGCGRAA